MLVLKYLKLIWGLPYSLIQMLGSHFIQSRLSLILNTSVHDTWLFDGFHVTIIAHGIGFAVTWMVTWTHNLWYNQRTLDTVECYEFWWTESLVEGFRFIHFLHNLPASAYSQASSPNIANRTEWFCFLTLGDMKILPMVSDVCCIPHPGTLRALTVHFSSWSPVYACWLWRVGGVVCKGYQHSRINVQSSLAEKPHGNAAIHTNRVIFTCELVWKPAFGNLFTASLPDS